MIYSFSLKAVGMSTGIFLIVLHLPALLNKELVSAWLKKFPRSRVWGAILLILAAAWALFLVQTIDLGEFARLRFSIAGFILIGAILSWRFLDEFLAVRSLGMLALLAANPILDACFLQTPAWRFLLVLLAYIWIVCGLFWVGTPYLLRDQIAWVSASSRRWKVATWAGLLFGVLLIGCSFFGTP